MRNRILPLRQIFCALMLLVLLTGCFPGLSVRLPHSGTPLAPDSSNIPVAQETASQFLQAWQQDDYTAMYALLTRVSQDAVSREDFEQIYRDASVNLSLSKFDFSILSVLGGAQTTQVNYRVFYHTALLGEMKRDIVMQLSLDQGQWRVAWDSGLILPELNGGNRLSIEYRVPSRGSIFDHNGKAIAAQADAMALGVEPGKLKKDQEEELLSILSQLTGKTPEDIRTLYHNSKEDYVPVGKSAAPEVLNLNERITAVSGLVVRPFRGRYYYDGGVAPHVTGYVQPIPAERLEEYRRNGYRGDEKVGAAGLEQWGEKDLIGQRGASLYLISPGNKIITRMVEVENQPAHYIYTTLDKDLQIQAQKALEGFRGAIVVLERDSGRILAMVSSPGYDPNLFDTTNANSAYLLGQVVAGEGQPLLNRAAQGTYPLGSVSKIITMAAALESGRFTPESSYNCGYEFTELGGGQTLYDWTYTYGAAPSGVLNLPEGLMLSCNPWFWHIGLDLFQAGEITQVSTMARAFGLGSKTGIEQVAESAGSFPDPQNVGEAVQEAIGQGPMLVTPLQVADFVAAVGNGGTLYRPQIIEKITSPDGDPYISFQPVVRGKLPVSTKNLTVIQDAMRSVVEDRRGTARNSFTGLQVPVYGKTGTAQNAGILPHAWFAGYTDARAQRPPGYCRGGDCGKRRRRVGGGRANIPPCG